MRKSSYGPRRCRVHASAALHQSLMHPTRRTCDRSDLWSKQRRPQLTASRTQTVRNGSPSPSVRAPMRRTRAPYRRVRASMVRRTAPQHGISERIQCSPNPFGVQPFRCPGERGAGGYINLRSFVLWWSGAGGGALTIELAIAMQDECDGMMSALEAALTDLNDNCASRKEFLVAVKAVRSHRVHACVRTSPSVQMCWTFERQYVGHWGHRIACRHGRDTRRSGAV
jgi:hypothetical protein